MFYTWGQTATSWMVVWQHLGTPVPEDVGEGAMGYVWPNHSEREHTTVDQAGEHPGTASKATVWGTRVVS